LQEDAWFTMPPIPAWVQGHAAIAAVFRAVIFTTSAPGQWRMYPTRANASPAFGMYRWSAEAGVYELFGLIVLSGVGERIANTVAFVDVSRLALFALPPTLAR